MGKFCLLPHLSLILICAFSPHHVDELLEVDGAVAVEVGLHDELEHLVLRRVLPDRPHHVQQLLRRDRAASILKEVWNIQCWTKKEQLFALVGYTHFLMDFLSV